MTWAEELLQEGRAEGVREGELRDKRAVLLRLVSRRFELTDVDRERILACENPAPLDAALDEVVVAQRKEDVLAKLG